MLMPCSRRIAVAAVLALTLAATCNTAAAMSLAEATRQFEAQGSRVLSADRKRHKGQEMYRFKLLTPEGRVRKVWVDPASGQRRR